MKKLELEEKDNKILKGVSKFLQIITIISKVCIYIVIPIIVLSMTIVPIIIKNIKVDENLISFKYKDNDLVIKKEDNIITAKYNDKNVDEEDLKAFELIYNHKNIFEDYSNSELIGYTEAGLLIAIAYLVVLLLILRNLCNLFKNIYDKPSPFTLENVEYLSKTYKYMIVLIIIPIIATCLYKLVADVDINFNFSIVNLYEILFIILISKVFKYGYLLESKKNEK